MDTSKLTKTEHDFVVKNFCGMNVADIVCALLEHGSFGITIAQKLHPQIKFKN